MKTVATLVKYPEQIECPKVRKAFIWLMKQKKRPYVQWMGYFEVIRVSIKGRTFYFQPLSGKWVHTTYSGSKKWYTSQGVADFLNQAVLWATKKSAPTLKQVQYLDSLCEQLGDDVKPEWLETMYTASAAIDDVKTRLKEVQE